MTEERLWTKEFITTSIVNFAIMLSMYLLLVTMATYAIETYHTSTSIAGLVSSVFIIGALIGRLYAGKQIERIGKKKMLFIGILIFVVMCFFYFLSVSLHVLIGIRLLQGIGAGISTTATGTIVSQAIPSKRKGEGIGYFSISVVLATAIGPLVGVGLLNIFEYSSIFVFSLLMGIISLILAFTIRGSTIEETIDDEVIQQRSFLSSFFEPKAIPIAIVTLVIAFAYSGILSFITTYAANINLTKAGGFYFFVYAVVILFTRPFTGKLMDVKGANSVAYPAIILFSLGMIIISQANSSFIFLFGAVVIGLGYGNFQSCTQALAIKLTPIHRMGLANSTYFIFLDLALGLGPLILGSLIPIVGFRGMYLLLSAVIFIGLFVYYILHGKKDRELTQLDIKRISS